MNMFHSNNFRLRFMALLLVIVQASISSEVRSQTLAERFAPWIAKHQGVVCIAVKHLGTGETFLYRETEVVPTASLIKFPVMIEYYRQVQEGGVSPDSQVILRKEDKVPGSGILTDHFIEGSSFPLETIVHLMITYSDNTATNLVLDRLGIAAVAKTMAEMGYPETQIHSKVFRRDTSIAEQRSQQYGLGSTTARDMLNLLEKLHDRALVSNQASEKMLGHLLSCDDKTKLMRFLPKEVKGYHKTGAVNETRTDAGLFHTPSGWIAMVCLTSQNQDKSWGESNAAEVLCGRIAQAAYEYFHPIAKEDLKPQLLKLGANGPLVEALQTALNDKLTPSPNLSVDGDFGGMTEKAVNQFRRENGLEEIGVVDAQVWSKLGEIQLDKQASETVVDLAPLEPADQPSGIPSVSCKAWIVADARTGHVLGGSRHQEPLDIASTTKIMTALLITTEIQEDPELLDEAIVFSTRADQTPGSSATVRAGESITLRDALYGLMLPSGNDAAVALAECMASARARSRRTSIRLRTLLTR